VKICPLISMLLFSFFGTCACGQELDEAKDAQEAMKPKAVDIHVLEFGGKNPIGYLGRPFGTVLRAQGVVRFNSNRTNEGHETVEVQRKSSIVWLLTGVMVLIFAAACGHTLSGAATAVAAKAGIREEIIAAIAVIMLVAGFALAIFVGLRDLTNLARRDVHAPPLRWLIGSIVAMLIAAPFWRLCVVHVQEPISGSDSVRTLFDFVLYGLVWTLVFPLGIGVPLLLARIRRQSHLDREHAKDYE
jgi:hypothetical protein